MEAEEWKAKQEREAKELRSNMAYLSDEQREVIHKTQKVLMATLQSVHDCHDLWMSDIRDLDEVMWRMKRMFPEATDD